MQGMKFQMMNIQAKPNKQMMMMMMMGLAINTVSLEKMVIFNSKELNLQFQMKIKLK